MTGKKNAAAVALGKLRKGKADAGELPSYQVIGKQGGQKRAKNMSADDRSAGARLAATARAAALTPEQRSAIAKAAAAKRWGKKATPAGSEDTEKSR